jgi:phosphatidylglycerophosphate synthase
MASTRQGNMVVEESIESFEKDSPPPQKLGGIFFWMTVGIALFKDLVVDPFSDLLIAAGMGMTATVVGAVVGIPLAVFVWLIAFGATCSVWLLMRVYFNTHGGVHPSAKMKRFAAWILAIIIGVIPVLKQLPETTILFFILAYLENAIRNNRLLSYASQFVDSKKG